MKEPIMNNDFNDDLNTPTEADLDQLYGSKFLSAADVGDKKIRTRIAKIRKEMLQQQSGQPRGKLVIYFTTLEKGMVLNATNKNLLVEKLGKNPADWIGTDVGILTENTTFAGKPTKGLRLHVLSPPKAGSNGGTGPNPPKPVAAAEAPPFVPPWDEEGDPVPQFES
jgi:hypothetical protein